MRNPKRYQNKANPEGALILRAEGISDPSDKAVPAPLPMPPLTLSGFSGALGVTDREVELYKPTEDVLKVGAAFLAGHSSIGAIKTYTGLESAQVRAVFDSAVAMQWVSRRTEALFRSRAAVIDTALYLRAAAGDLKAIELFYKRMKLLEESTKRVEINYSGGVNLTAVSDDELARIVRDKTRLLPAEFKVLDDGNSTAKIQEATQKKQGMEEEKPKP